MAWLFVPGLGDSNSASDSLFQALESCATWRGKLHPLAFWQRAWRKVSWMRRLSGGTAEAFPSTGCGKSASTSSPPDSPASRTASPASARAPLTIAGSGHPSPTPFAFWDQPSSSWRMCQGCLLPGLDTFSGTWPRSGMMQSGQCSAMAPVVLHTAETGSGSWPTPDASVSTGYNQTDSPGAAIRPALGRAVQQWPTPQALSFRDSHQPGQVKLDLAARNWHTPKASADKSGNPRKNDRQDLQAQSRRWGTPTAGSSGDRTSSNRTMLGDQVQTWPTPMAADAGRQGETHVGGNLTLLGAARSTGLPGSTTPDGPTASPSSGPSSRPPLNPRFAAWLMGFPDGWISSGPTETEWARWWQQSRSLLSQLVRGLELADGQPTTV